MHFTVRRDKYHKAIVHKLTSETDQRNAFTSSPPSLRRRETEGILHPIQEPAAGKDAGFHAPPHGLQTAAASFEQLSTS